PSPRGRGRLLKQPLNLSVARGWLVSEVVVANTRPECDNCRRGSASSKTGNISCGRNGYWLRRQWSLARGLFQRDSINEAGASGYCKSVWRSMRQENRITKAQPPPRKNKAVGVWHESILRQLSCQRGVVVHSENVALTLR